jgi:hypothetical protein
LALFFPVKLTAKISKNMQQTLRVGVYDWHSFSTDNSFYPEDMPAEWRLAYYANEFETACICLTPQILQSSDDLEWLEDLPAGFQLFVDEQTIKVQKSELLPQLKNFKTVLSAAGIAAADQYINAADCWKPDEPVCSNFALMPGAATLKQYRQWIERWIELSVGHDGQQDQILWLQGGSTRYSTLAELRTLVELMGL